MAERLSFFLASLVLGRSKRTPPLLTAVTCMHRRSQRIQTGGRPRRSHACLGPIGILIRDAHLPSSPILKLHRSHTSSSVTESVKVPRQRRVELGCRSLPHTFVLCSLRPQPSFAPDLISLAVFCVLGVFTRPTFLAFALPMLLSAFVWTVRRAAAATSDQPRSAFARTWLQLVSLPVGLGSVYVACITVVDTLFFRQTLYGFVLTPLNFLRYNLSSSNLAEHGVHPRSLHLVVNLPLVIGPGLVYYGIRATLELWKRSPTSAVGEKGKAKGGPTKRSVVFTSTLVPV